MTCLGVWATFARLVLTRNKVRVFSSIRFNSSWRAAGVVGNGETDISEPPLLLLKCLLQDLTQRLPLWRVGCHPAWHPDRPDESQCWSGAPPDSSCRFASACSVQPVPGSSLYR